MLSPNLFTDAKMKLLEPIEILVFQALWCHADRVGVLRDKPEDLSVQVLPWLNLDMDRILARLVEVGLVLRYSSDRGSMLWVPKFLEHQKPHQHERDSGLPFPTPEQRGLAPKLLKSLVGISRALPGPTPKPPEQPLQPVGGVGNHAESPVGVSLPARDRVSSRSIGREAYAAPQEPLPVAQPGAVAVSEEKVPDHFSKTTTPTTPLSPSVGLEGEREAFVAHWNAARKLRGATRKEVLAHRDVPRLDALLAAAFEQGDRGLALEALQRFVKNLLEAPGFNRKQLRYAVDPNVWTERLDAAFMELTAEETKRQEEQERRRHL